MNDFEHRRIQPQHYYSQPYEYMYGERNAPLTLSHGARHDPRGCPVVPRARAGSREEPASDTGQPRRRIAVACARCRKRKIKCSGDPGNGSGCNNCRTAGTDITCQFHRVGSDEAIRVLNTKLQIDALTNTAARPYLDQNGMMPIYNVGTSLHSRPFSSSSYPYVNTKPTYPSTWTAFPLSEETSPVENYGTTPAYMQSHDAVYGDSFRWYQASQKPISTASSLFLNQDTPSSYSTLPYLSSTALQATASADGLSPLNMTSLQSTLPVSVPEKSAHVPERQLPIPLPTRSRSSLNMVDQLHTQIPNSTNNALGINTNGTFTKAVMAWNAENADSQSKADRTTSSSSDSKMPAPAKDFTPSTTVPEPVLGYLPVTSSSPESSPPNPTPVLNMSTTSLPESMPAPPNSATSFNFATPSLPESFHMPSSNTYSNFRNYDLPASSSGEILGLLSRQDSHSNLYSFSSDSSAKRHSIHDMASPSTLVSGQRYAPLHHPQPQHAASIETLRRDSFNHHQTRPIHRTSVPNLNHNFYSTST